MKDKSDTKKPDAKVQTSVRMSPATREKLDALVERRYKTATETIAVALDRLYREEVIQMPKFCTKCKGHGKLAKVVRGFQKSQYAGQPWTGTVDRSKDAQNDVIRPETCPRCGGDGYEPN